MILKNKVKEITRYFCLMAYGITNFSRTDKLQ